MADDKGRIRTPMSPAVWADDVETDVVTVEDEAPAKESPKAPAKEPAKAPAKTK